MFNGKVAVITGGAQGIGKAIADEFIKNGAIAVIIDKQSINADSIPLQNMISDINTTNAVYLTENTQKYYYVGDISKKEVLENFVTLLTKKFAHVDYLINNALPIMKGLSECSYEDFEYALQVGVTAPFYLTKLLTPAFSENAAIVNISSSRDRMSQPETESYTAAKGGIASLTHALAVTLAGRVRVNSISPGWIDTDYKIYKGPDALQQPVQRVGNPMDIANMVLFLCSEKAGFITGENICIDGGMTKQMIYHDDYDWTYNPHNVSY